MKQHGRILQRGWIVLVTICLVAALAPAHTQSAQSMSSKPVLYLVANSHLDSQWDLPAGDFDRLYVIAAAVGGDVPATFSVNSVSSVSSVVIREWQGPVGQWDSRLKDAHLLHEVVVPAINQRQARAAQGLQADLVVEHTPVTGAVTD
jgi:hypothetical protein